MPHPFVVQVSLVVWKDLVVYRVRRRLLFSLLELSAPVLLLALFWCTSAAHPDTGRVRLDAGAAGPRRDPCDAPYKGRRLAFAPRTSPYARELLLRAFPELAATEELEGFENRRHVLEKAESGTLGADVVVLFDGIEEANGGKMNAPGDLNYTLLFDEALPPQRFSFRCPGPRAIDEDQEEMLASTLWPVQCRLNRAHLDLYAETRKIEPRPPVMKIRMKRFPLPSMVVDVGACQPLYPWVALFLFEVGFLPLCLNYLYRFIEEKINDKREWMLIQGLRNGAFLWGKGVACFVFSSLPCLVAVSVLTWPHPRFLFTALSYSEPSVLFAAIFLPYAARLAASCVLFGTLFMNRWACAHAFTLWWLVGAILALDFEMEFRDFYIFALCVFMPNFWLTFAVRAVWHSERKGAGLSWASLSEMGGWPVTVSSPLSLVLLLALVWYLDSVWPWPDRMRRKNFQFLLQDEFWQLSPDAANKSQPPDKHCCSQAGEPAVCMVNVAKRVGDLQMEHLSIDFIRNNITVIFGHSGSGKSTLIKMICGILHPDEGSIYVHDVNVQYSLPEARSFISYCAENSTLFDFMTVKEHIQLSKLLNESSPSPAARREVDTTTLLQNMRLSGYANACISTLAVGVRRKVALAVALSRPAEVLVLDEPTSGMDAISQADVWKLLWIMRRSSTIIMTTNKSAEVDVLADRAVVLARGVVQLNDDIDNLHRDLRLGYRLCLLRHERASSEAIHAHLRSCTPDIRVLSEIGHEIMLYLPGVTAASARELASSIRREQRHLGLTHVGEPYQTIEDGVMRIWGLIHQPAFTAPSSPDYTNEALRLHLERPEAPHLCWSVKRRFVALSTKKLRLLWARWPALLLAALASGVLFRVLYASLADRAVASPGDARALVRLDAASVGLGAFVSDWRPSPEFAGVVIRSLLDDSGVDHRLPLDEEPEQYLRSLSAREWRHQGWGIELHAGGPGPAGSGHWATLWWSAERWASSGAALTTLHAAQLANASRVRGARIRARAGSLPGARRSPSAQQLLERAFNDVPVVACVVAVSAVLAPATGLFAAVPHSENRSGMQLLQLMTGLLSFDYWLSHSLWDFAVLHVLGFCVPVAPAFLWFFGDRGARFLLAALTLFLAYGVAAIPAAHLISKVFPSGCQVTIIFISLTFGVVPTLLEIVWDAEGPDAAPVGRVLTSASRAVPSAALSAGLTRLLRLHAVSQLCELPDRQRVALCRELKPRVIAPRAAEALALCCPGAHELEMKEVPSWPDLTARDASLTYDMAALLGCGFVALLLSSLGDAVLLPLLHRLRYMGWRRAGTSTSHKVAAIEASGLMQPVAASVRLPQSSVPGAGTSGIRSSPTIMNPTSPVSPYKEKGDMVLEATGLERRFGGQYAVCGVSLSVREGECVGLLGQSGAGKSTMLRMLSGELLPTAGACVVYGNDLRSQRAGYVTRVGYQPSSGGYVPELTARQHLELLAALRLLPNRNVRPLVNHVLRLVDLDREADKHAEHYWIPECLSLCSRVLVLSGGERTWAGSVADLRNTFFMGMVVTVTLSAEQKRDGMVVFLRRVYEIFGGEAQMVSKHKNVVRFKIRDPLYSMRSLKHKLVDLRNVNAVRDVDFGHVALHKLFGVQEHD
ncbi:phospholipid-transporting ATPase ABCA3-like isoform X2 [Dermacentor albipictus]|uniref:phospholipid-transporting ATPase ABCA3-like isoform X2 n=1 Tax=Dermacentor albipictus TaxID=60249 RepID=UPI0038FC5D7B